MVALNNLVDETTNIKNELVTCHTNLKNNLLGMGLEISPIDKLPKLVNEVLNIKTGKKWASGMYNKSNFSEKHLTIPISLDFEPKLIFCIIPYILYWDQTDYLSDAYNMCISNIEKTIIYKSGSTEYSLFISSVNRNSIEIDINLHLKEIGEEDILWYAFE